MMLLLLKCLPALLHPFFVSMTEIGYNAKDKEVEISIRVFTDDLENSIKKQGGGAIDLAHPANRDKAATELTAYLKKHFALSVDGKPVEWSFLGFEQQSESTWSYLYVQQPTAPRRISVRNNLLHEEHPEQVNMMSVKVGGVEKTWKLDFPEAFASFSF